MTRAKHHPARARGRRSPLARLVALISFAFVVRARLIVASSDDYYKLLGVDRNADERTLKKNYRIQALKHHPDKGGSPEHFAKISEAYEALTDPEKRRVYDQYGAEGLRNQQAGGHPGGGGGFGGGGFGHPGMRFEFNQRGGGGGPFGGGDPFGDIFGDMFGRGGGGGRGGRRHPHQQQRQQQQRPKENLFDKKSPVTSLRQGRFPGTDAKNIWFISFYAPWCGHCQQMKSQFEELAKALNGFVRVGAVNCEKQKGLCAMEGVDSYPTLKLKKAGVSTTYDSGGHGFQQMYDWVMNQLPVSFASLRKTVQLEKFVATDCTKWSSSGSACVIFLNDKHETPAWFKVTAYAFRDRMHMAESRSNNLEMGLHFDVVKQPVLMVLCDGDMDKTVAYGGKLDHDMKSAEVEKWLESYAKSYATGCARVKAVPKQGLKLDPSKNYSKMKVSAIKALMQVHSIPCVSCYEKSDFVNAINAYIEEKFPKPKPKKKRGFGAEYLHSSFAHDDF